MQTSILHSPLIRSCFIPGTGDMSTTGVGPMETNCPINGQFTLTYSRQMSTSQAENSADELCARKSSILTNCPGKDIQQADIACWRDGLLRA